MKYEFVLMYYGEEIGRQTFNKYENAQRFFCNEYFNYDRGCLTFIDGKEYTLYEAYDYFNLAEYNKDYIWHKDKNKLGVNSYGCL